MQYDISKELFKIYVSMMRFLVKADAGHDVTVLDTVLSMLLKLRKSFYESADRIQPVRSCAMPNRSMRD